MHKPTLRSRLAATGLFLVWSGGPRFAAIFTWKDLSADWLNPANWVEAIAPSGTNPTDQLKFGGDVATPYVSTNNLPPVPALINSLTFEALDTGATGSTHQIAGSAIALGGIAPQIEQRGVGAFTINAPLHLAAPVLLTGNGGTVTLNNKITGMADLVKSGTSTFRFGTQSLPGPPVVETPSENTWFGRLTINEGTVRFNNNATAGRTALRGNPITLSAGTTLSVRSELRVGTLTGAAGLVETEITGTNTNNESIIVHVLGDGTFGGTVRLDPPTGISGTDDGELVIRGAGAQTFTGILQITKDTVIGRHATMVLGGTASLATSFVGQAARAGIIFNGGTLRLDNSTTNNNNRLRDLDPSSTGIDVTGGGTLSLVGSSTAATSETVGRLQLGATNARAGAMTLNVVHNAGATAGTQLNLQALSRDSSTSVSFATVHFSANDGAGNPLTLGQAGSNPRITFITAPPLANSLFRDTQSGAGASTVGFATVGTSAGWAFATHGANGVAAVGLSAAPDGATTGSATANVQITDSITLSNTSGYALNSLRLAPSAAGQSMTLSTTGDLRTNAILLAGPIDYTIDGATGGLSGASPGTGTRGPRYIHAEEATLTMNAPINRAAEPIVKAGPGTLVLTNAANVANTTPTVINAGVLRATPGSSLPDGELRFRGGVFEIVGGGTFSRTVGSGTRTVNWETVDAFGAGIGQDRGSGGFAAIGADASVDLNVAGPDELAWEATGFVESGHALIFGSRSATNRITLVDNLSLTAAAQIVNYNAREIRVDDNPASQGDIARITGAISGRVQDDLLKLGPGTLELTGNNTYRGATLVHEGALLVNGVTSQTFLVDVRDGAVFGGNGTVGDNSTLGAVRVENGGQLRPGSTLTNTGLLRTGEVTFVGGEESEFSIDVGGTLAGTGYDQVSVTGGITLNGATLTGSLLNNFAPGENDLFFILLNDGTDAVQGTFAQGSLVTLGDQQFEISYDANAGGVPVPAFHGGNDVALRLIPEPSAALLLLGGGGLLFGRRRRTR